MVEEIPALAVQLLSPEIEKDMKEFLFKITDETVDLKSLGIRGTEFLA